MKNNNVYEIDHDNKFVKKLEKSIFNSIVFPIGTMFCMLVFVTVIYLLSTNSNFSNNAILDWIDINSVAIMYLFIIIATIGFIYNVIYFAINMTIQNSIIIKEENNILILHKINEISGDTASTMMMGSIIANGGSNVGTILGSAISLKEAKNIKANENQQINLNIKNIIDNPRSIYKLYTNCKSLKETRKYYLFNGNNASYNGTIKNTNFKVYKFYKNIKNIF